MKYIGDGLSFTFGSNDLNLILTNTVGCTNDVSSSFQIKEYVLEDDENTDHLLSEPEKLFLPKGSKQEKKFNHATRYSSGAKLK